MKGHLNTIMTGNATEDAEKRHHNFAKWLSKLINEVAGEMGMTLTKVQIVDGRHLGCRDAHLIKIAADGNLTSTVIHEYEFSVHAGQACSERTKNKIRSAILKCS